MMIRQDFGTFPPLPPRAYLEQLMNGVTKVYCWLWDNKDKNLCIDSSWKDITKVHSKTAFRACIRKLGVHGLISFNEDAEGIHVELVGWDEVMSCLED